jgi:hypothetical protein
MKTLLATLVLCASALAGAGAPTEDPAWDKLKTLVGEWKGTYAGADGAGEVRLSYELASNGTSLIETMQSGHDANMVTVYHRDGRRIMATHYCSVGNQPRMTAAGLSPDGKTLTFRLLDATNVSPDSEVMQGLVVTFEGPDRFAQSWTSRAKGQDQVGTFTYSRVK